MANFLYWPFTIHKTGEPKSLNDSSILAESITLAHSKLQKKRLKIVVLLFAEPNFMYFSIYVRDEHEKKRSSNFVGLMVSFINT